MTNHYQTSLYTTTHVAMGKSRHGKGLLDFFCRVDVPESERLVVYLKIDITVPANRFVIRPLESFVVKQQAFELKGPFFLFVERHVARSTSGWYKTHRKIMSNWISNDCYALAIWHTLLSWASFTETKTFFDGKFHVVKAGQVITSLRELEAKLGCDRRTIKRRLDSMQADDMIVTEIGHKGTVITICNWSKYQGSENDDVPLSPHESTAECKPECPPECEPECLHNKNIKKEKKNKEGKERADAINPEILFQIWNTHCGTLSKADKLTEKRKSKARTRLKENPDLDYWITVVNKMANSTFCRDSGWANFDWIINDDTNSLKAFEGKYDDRISTKKDEIDWKAFAEEHKGDVA